MRFLEDLLINNGLSENLSWWLNFIFTSLILLTIAWLLRLITRRILIFLFNKFAKTTKFTFDDALVKHKFPKNLSRYIPYLFLSSAASLWSNNSEIVLSWLSAIIDLYAVLISVYLIRSFLRAAREELQKKDQFKDKPIDSYIQVVLIFIWSLAILVSFSIISGKELIYFFTGIGALSAVLLLVFRDTILGFVASIQIAANDLVRIGDWITMESYGADGDVVEINLSTIKVKNFDNTITTVPTYKLLSSAVFRTVLHS
jgi:miniconductance mechanosensitive channel